MGGREKETGTAPSWDTNAGFLLKFSALLKPRGKFWQ